MTGGWILTRGGTSVRANGELTAEVYPVLGNSWRFIVWEADGQTAREHGHRPTRDEATAAADAIMNPVTVDEN